MHYHDGGFTGGGYGGYSWDASRAYEDIAREYAQHAYRSARAKPMLHLIQLGLPRKIEAFRNNSEILRLTIPGGTLMKVGHRLAMQTTAHTWIFFVIVDLKHDEKKAETVITMEINR